MACYTFEKKWTFKSRDEVREFENIFKIRIEHLENQIGGFENLLIDGIKHKMTNFNAQTNYEQYDSFDNFVAALEDDIIALTDRLHTNNIYMNRCIVSMISKYQKLLDEELKSFLELIGPIFFNMREAESTYSKILVESVKQVISNPRKIISDYFMNYFKNK